MIVPRDVAFERACVLFGELKLPVYSAAMCSGSVAGGWHSSVRLSMVM
jgi:hypothetical protein